MNVLFVPEYVLFVPGFGKSRPNLPGVFEEKWLFVPIHCSFVPSVREYRPIF